VWVFVIGFFEFLSAVFHGFSVVLDSRGRLGVLVRNLRTVRMIYWVNVSESAGSPGFSRYMFVVFVSILG